MIDTMPRSPMKGDAVNDLAAVNFDQFSKPGIDDGLDTVAIDTGHRSANGNSEVSSCQSRCSAFILIRQNAP